jgi:formamidopyrimidine-DNA glycosylase
MPELPEVETARRGIEPHLVGKRIVQIVVREPRLRWPVTTSLVQGMQGQTIRAVERRAKYILLRTDAGTAILHLGMSGSLRVLPSKTAPQKWDHVDILLADGQCLRLRDPRRFGALLWTTDDPARHKLLRDLGPEPFDRRFDGNYLFGVTRRRTVAVRDFLLNGRIVAGVGNIYANEALFLSGIRPTRRTGRHPCGRHHPARFPERRRPAGLFSADPSRIRTIRRALSVLRLPHPGSQTRSALRLFLSKMPNMRTNVWL